MVKVVCERPSLFRPVAPGKSTFAPLAERTATVSACTRTVRAEWIFAVAVSRPLAAAETDSESTTTPAGRCGWLAHTALPMASMAAESTRADSLVQMDSLRRCLEVLGM
ncbi:hypothetical protein [Streptomyces sp. ISL-100]|uniref:hypothetical protein n=1 Tax=Streptomyces sp. ISL-100 TaxID=2819173 RepID=UPI001BE8E274|nr:hypothetical protein [Streptomyces sp. ISL-100]MBT2400127.1 hypothetical protein [Streptomyces sp. ISL-100]